MGLKIYDFRQDVRNLLVTPQIRSRFLRMEPGQVASRHSHDLGHEIFLILQGQARFNIGEEEAKLGPGQLCIARADEPHQVRVVGNEPMVMYLSVTPHVQPTHTSRTDTGEAGPTRFQPSNAYDMETDTDTPIAELVDRYSESARSFAEAAIENARIQEEIAASLKQSLAASDEVAADQARCALWQALYQTYTKLYALTDLWNDVAPRAGEVE